jgi:hypothetical protein
MQLISRDSLNKDERGFEVWQPVAWGQTLQEFKCALIESLFAFHDVQ